MTRRHSYLLYDGNCGGCRRLAEQVGTASAGRVHAADLRERTFQQLIATVRPDWRYEPTLLSVRGDAVRVATGLALRMRMLRLLRPRAAVRITLAARRFGVPVLGLGPLGLRPHPPALAADVAATGLDTPLRINPDRAWELSLSEGAGTADLRWNTTVVQFPAHVVGELRFLAEHGAVRVTARELPGGLDGAGRLVLVRTLLDQAFLILV